MGKWCLEANIQRYCSRKLYPGVNIQCCCPPSLVSIWLTSVPKNQTFCFPFAQRHVQTRSQTRSQKIHGILLETVRPTGARIWNFIWFFQKNAAFVILRYTPEMSKESVPNCIKVYRKFMKNVCQSQSHLEYGHQNPENGDHEELEVRK